MSRDLGAALAAISLSLLAACSAPGPKYRQVGQFSEGLAPVQSASGQWGYINLRQQWVITPRFEEAREFQGGRAAAKQSGKWGFINKQGQWQ